MATFLFDKIIFGPVQSRRLGVSLGINLLPVNSKICSFDCIYCECGLNPKPGGQKNVLPSRDKVAKKLREKLMEMAEGEKLPDVITFAGNGEPTLHPDFEGIIDDTIELRNIFAPQARVAVLSNATAIDRKPVFNALKKVDDNILKLDSAFHNTLRIMNCPPQSFDIDRLTGNLKQFNGQLIIQTMFLKGSHKGEAVDNTTDEEVAAWIKLIKEIAPQQVMIYSIDRDTPIDTLEKIPVQKLDEIAQRLETAGINVQVSS